MTRWTTTLRIGFFVGACLVLHAVSAQNTELTRKRYLPEYTAKGELILPKNFSEWIYVGSPTTPHGLNGGKAGFPEFHNVYIEPGSYERCAFCHESGAKKDMVWTQFYRLLDK